MSCRLKDLRGGEGPYELSDSNRRSSKHSSFCVCDDLSARDHVLIHATLAVAFGPDIAAWCRCDAENLRWVKEEINLRLQGAVPMEELLGQRMIT